MTSQPRTHRYAVAYDLSDDRERSRVDKVLKGWGHRAQKSVFLVLTSRYGLKQLRAELEVLKLESGTVLILRLQNDVDPVAVGQPFADPDAEIAYVV
jgi:CRISPR-associated protein Cas2